MTRQSVFFILGILVFYFLFQITAYSQLRLTDSEKIDEINQEVKYLRTLIGELRQVTDRLLEIAKVKLTVGATEYLQNENATTFVQLSKDGKPIANALCILDIYNPNKTKLFDNQPLTQINGSNGLYFFDWVTPNKTGVYIYDSVCFFEQDSLQNETGDAFKGVNFSAEVGTFVNTRVLDSVVHRYKEQLIGSATLDTRYNFTGITLPITNLDQIISLNVTVVYKWNDNAENIRIELFNFNTSTFVPLTNPVTFATSFNTVHNLVTFSENPSNYITSLTGGVMILRFNDIDKTDISVKELELDLINIGIGFTNGTVSFVRGSAEGHVSEIDSILNSINQTILDTNSSIFSKLFKIQDEITSINNTLISVNSTLFIEINEVDSEVWSFPNRTVDNATFVQNVENVTFVQNATVTNISDDVLKQIARRVWEFFWNAGSVGDFITGESRK